MSERPAAGEVALAITASKYFGDRRVLFDAALTVRRGTIHALVGENGAGKSTLMKIAAGLVAADGGELFLEGAVDLRRHSQRIARSRGLGMVQQHGTFAPTLSVVENAVLGAEPGSPMWIDLDGAAAALAKLADQTGLAVDPHATVSSLSLGERHRAETLAVLFRGAKILILDEPTAVFAPSEVDGFLATLRRLAAAGTSVVLVSHKLAEVRAVADAITVLRAGRVVAELDGKAAPEEVARAIVGGELAAIQRPVAPRGEPVLEVDRLTVAGDRGRGMVASFTVAAGEILGVAGVEGNGQHELALGLAGMLPAQSGTLRLGGRDLTRASVAQRLTAGLGHIPDDRHQLGLVLAASAEDNLALGRLGDVSPGFVLDRRRLADHAARLIADLDVRPADPGLAAAAFSGGNQQKIVVARELSRPHLRALIAAQPTRGVDLGAARLIHDRLRRCAAAGVAIVLVSADLDELLGLGHRIVVVYRQRLVGAPIDPSNHDARAEIGMRMTGGGVA